MSQRDKHSYEHMFHCPNCWDKGVRRLEKEKMQPSYLLIPSGEKGEYIKRKYEELLTPALRPTKQK